MTHLNTDQKPSVNALVQSLKDAGCDHEWYPTTDEMIDTIRDDLHGFLKLRQDERVTAAVLDCGAGDGRVLMKLTDGPRYALEKAQPLMDVMDNSIFIVGTDFHKQTLIDKQISGAVFSNPPYSEYAAWSIKIIKEACAPVAYLVIPSRWSSNRDIQEAIEARSAIAEVIGSFDFLEADRKARATVDIVRVNLYGHETSYWHRSPRPRVDPFDLWFDENFKVKASGGKLSEFEQKEAARSSIRERVSSQQELVKDQGLVHTLEQFYHRDLQKLIANYQSVCDLDPDLLTELGVSVEGLKGALRLKISSLKNVYWMELVNTLHTITDRLTSDSRKKMLEKLTANTSIDFNAENAHSLAIWMIKNANEYFESQLISAYERMIDKANVSMYASNQRTFRDEQWRYCNRPHDLEKFKLEYRVVLDRVGGLCNSEYSFEHTASGLTERAAEFLDDLCTIASNLGFDTYKLQKASSHYWESNKSIDFYYREGATGELKQLFDAKAFKNGNLHIRFTPAFIIALNVEFGRLRGWVKSAQEAADEMGIDVKDAAKGFGSNLTLLPKDAPLMLTAA